MPQRYRLFRRHWGVYYLEDTHTGKQQTLGTSNKGEAQRLAHVRNEAHNQPMLNREIGLAYLAASEPAMLTRTWRQVMDQMATAKNKSTQAHWLIAIKDKAFDPIRDLRLVETTAEHFLKVLRAGTVSTNVFLRRIHNFALDMRWIAGPVIVKRQWPKAVYREKRAITENEHTRIITAESNPERRLYYEVLWHTGGSQSDIATLSAENIDWEQSAIIFDRKKVRWRNQSPPVLRVGSELEIILRQLPRQGFLFPSIARITESDRGSLFARRCKRLEIEGISLHSYRYSWAERARECGYPERFAQAALGGHTSKAVHRAYSRNAEVHVPSLEAWQETMKRNVVKMAFGNPNKPELTKSNTDSLPSHAPAQTVE